MALQAGPTPLLRGKLLPPGLPSVLLRRPRLESLFESLVEEYDVVAVLAAPGSGKTVATQQFADRFQWPVAWVTLDPNDQSPTRLLTYVAAALERYCPGARKSLESAFRHAVSAEEAAALLAESAVSDRLLVVLDQCEVIADSPECGSVLNAFLNYLPRGVRTILLGRDEMPISIGRLLIQQTLGRVGASDLALTAEEAGEWAHIHGDDPATVVERSRLAGGWIAAVAFWSKPWNTFDPSQDFDAYLGAEMLDRLSDEERRLIIETSILDRVDLSAAINLCGPQVASTWRSLQIRHLPATMMSDGTIVLHPCVREFLLKRLREDEPERVAELMRRHAKWLLEQQHPEEAVELFLSAGDRSLAAVAAELAMPVMLNRGDWTTAMRWLDALGDEDFEHHPSLVGAKLRCLRNLYRLDEARSLVRRLDEGGKLDVIMNADPGVISYAAGAMLWHPRDGLRLLERYDRPGPASAVIRYLLEVSSSSSPVEPPADLTTAESDRLVSWGLLLQGRLRQLVAMLPSDEQWPPKGPNTTPHPLLGLLWRGEHRRAKELYDQVPERIRTSMNTELWLYLETCLHLANHDTEAALQSAQRAMFQSQHVGASSYRPVVQISLAQVLLELGRIDESIEILEESLRISSDAGLAAYVEWAKTFLGRALIESGDPRRASELLHEATEAMERSQRRLFLPTAAAYLSEAEWRLGNEAASDAAADLAYQTSDRIGSFAGLQAAVTVFPGVLHRQIELDAPRDWRELGSTQRRSASRLVSSEAASSSRKSCHIVEVQPFGHTPDVSVDGMPMGLGRLKLLELICFVATQPGAAARRDDVQLHLLPDSDRRRASNYFRQLIHQLRKITGLEFQRLPDSRITWSSEFTVDTTDLRMERLLREARAVSGEDRMTRLMQALDLAQGAYLAGSDLEWVSERRFQLAVLQEEAEIEIADLALRLARFDIATEYGEAILARNPNSPTAYRTLLEVQLAAGTRSSALATYRRARAALDEVGLNLGSNITKRLDSLLS